MNNPKITVVTVTYNCAATLERTIQSIVNQGYNNLEYIIIDGVSTDGTLDIIQKYDTQISYFASEPDKGIYDAMNKAVDAASGDWIYFLGGDDTLHDGVLNQIAMQLKDPDTTYYGDVILQPIGKRYAGRFNKFKLCRMNICHQAIFYCKKAFANGNRYNLDYRMYADYLLNINLFSNNEHSFNYIPVLIADFQLAGQSEQGDKLFFENRKQLIQDNFSILVYLYYLVRVAFISGMIEEIRGVKR